MKDPSISILVAIGLAFAGTAVVLAVEPTVLVQHRELPVYAPVTSDLMNSVIQPRHIKLWLAGEAGNWEFAEYERHNIGGALARMAVAIPNYKGLPTEKLITSFATPQLDQLEKAIKAKDAAAFEQSYGELTKACNACHTATGHPFVVIETPSANSFPDQDFRPLHG